MRNWSENYNSFDDYERDEKNKKIHILIIYDISENKTRTKLVKFLLGYGYRVQKSAFEAIVTKSQLKKIIKNISNYLDEENDSIRIYRMYYDDVIIFGKNFSIEDEEIIII